MKSIFALALIITMSTTGQANAQSQPIFVSPYKPGNDTYTSRVPTTVQATQDQGRRVTPSNRLAGPGLTNNSDPFAGTGFGRIKQEINYFDEQTGRRMNQYDYMALLVRRGDNARFAQVRQYVQENGVFDPKKFQTAMTTGPYGSNPQVPAASKANQATSAHQQEQQQKRRRVVVKEEQKNAMPTRVHRGYDDEPAPRHQPGAPIFLR